MSNPADTNRYAPPEARVDDMAPEAGALGGRGARLLAAIVDGLLQAGLYYALVYILPFMPTPARSLGEMSFGKAALQLLFGFAIFCAINGWLLANRGQTVGKRLLGLRIVRRDGSPASFGRLVGLRYGISWILYVIPVVGMLYVLIDDLMIFGASRRCVHDKIADTIVVRA